MFIHWVARRRASRGSLSRGGRARDAPPRPQMATRRPSTPPAGSRRAWPCMRWPFRPTRGSRGYLRSHSFAVIRAQNGCSEVRDRVWTKQRTVFDLSSAARSGLAVVLRSRGARAVDSCRASGSKAAPRAGRTASGACQRPRGTSSKHALHHNCMRSLSWLLRRRTAAAALRWGQQSRTQHTQRHASPGQPHNTRRNAGSRCSPRARARSSRPSRRPGPRRLR